MVVVSPFVWSESVCWHSCGRDKRWGGGAEFEEVDYRLRLDKVVQQEQGEFFFYMRISWKRTEAFSRTEDKNYTSEAVVLFPEVIHRSSTPPSNTPTAHPLTSLLTPHSPSYWSPCLHLLPPSAPGVRPPSHHPSPPSGLSCYDTLFLSNFIT